MTSCASGWWALEWAAGLSTQFVCSVSHSALKCVRVLQASEHASR